jgi:catechol 2,3-dioxygenase-like lactoylglutathione lyase family enzyme
MTKASAPFRIKSVDHTGITVSSLDAALSFWVGGMGFTHLYTWDFENTPFTEELVGVKPAAMRLAMVEGPGHLIELLEYRAPGNRQVLKPRPCDVGSVHVAFYVTNIRALVARLSTIGWNALGKVQTIESGDRTGLSLLYVRGPDGMTLEFFELPGDAFAGRSVSSSTEMHDEERRSYVS